jgi:predicted transposase/invertase (TIGR01784 family)
MVMKQEPTIAKAEQILEHLGSLDEIRRYYEAREMKIHDEITRITEAREEGLTQGITQGITREKSDTARKMLLKNMDERLITEITGLSSEQLQKIKMESTN